MTGSITPQQTEFLYLLSKTGFLTNKHLEQVDFAKLKNSKHYLTKRLLDGGYIGRMMVSTGFGFGRKSMYFLVKRGAELVAEAYNLPLESLSYSPLKGGIYKATDGNEVNLIRADFIHKEAYILAFLAFEMHLQNTDYALTDYRHYYQLKGDKSTAISVNGKNIRPDGIWWATSHTAEQKDFCFLVEIHRHSERKHIIRQLLTLVEAIKQRSVQNRFGTNYPPLVLSVFTGENGAVMRGVLDELKQSEHWAIIEKFFLFAKLDDLMTDFYKGLGYFGGTKKPVPKNIEN